MTKSPAGGVRIKRILWSLDAFEDKSNMRNHVVSALKYLAHRLPAVSTDALYVLSPNEFDVDVEFSAPWVKRYLPSAEKALASTLASVDLARTKPRVVSQRLPSLTASVQTVLKQAALLKSDLIVTGTHAREGLDRWVLGSFTETLLAHSKLPLLVVGPESQCLHRDHILFATDMSVSSAAVFKRVLSLAKDLRAKLTILNVVPQPLEAVVQSGIYLMGGGWVPVGDFMSGEEMRKRKQGQKWIEEAQKAGVQAEFVVDRGQSGTQGSVAAVILAHAQNRHAGMIAMASQSGKVSAAIIGSVARQVMRRAPCPVWVWRPGK